MALKLMEQQEERQSALFLASVERRLAAAAQ